MTAEQTARLDDAQLLREPGLAALLDVLDRDGEEARVVGGAVRNELLGAPVADIDLATTAPPAEVMRRAEGAGFKPVPTGLAHGTVTVVVRGQAFEVTTLRRDVATDGRHAEVAFGRDWAEDARRRDFTINALTLSRDGVVHDFVGGLADITARRVRFIGTPDERIREDFLRILRFFRFHATYAAGPPDADGLTAVVRERAGLARLSRERIGAEMRKLLVAPGAAAALTVMAETGLLETILGGVPRLARFGHLADIESALGFPADPVRRLAALALFVREDAERLAERLRLSRAEAERLAGLAETSAGCDVTAEMPEAAAKRLLYRLGPAAYRERVLLAWASAPGSAEDPAWTALARLPERWTAPRFPLTGADLLARGVAAGPRVGATLRAIEARWIAAGFPGDPAWLAAAVDAAR